MKRIITGIAAAVACAVGLVASTALAGGGHDPVTVCHKPGTPAEQTLTFDDDAYEAHLAHGDTRGPCEGTPPPDTTGEEECGDGQYQEECVPDPTTPTETTPTTPTPPPPPPAVTTPDPPRLCPDGQPPTQGEEAFDPNDDCKRPPPPVVTTTPSAPPAAVPPAVTPPTVTPPATTPPASTPPAAKPPKAADPAVPKPDAPPLTMDDPCEKLNNGLMRCKPKGGPPVIVVQGSG